MFYLFRPIVTNSETVYYVDFFIYNMNILFLDFCLTYLFIDIENISIYI